MVKYITKSGDTWDSIAFDLYGDYKTLSQLILMNPEYMDTLIFSGGIDIDVPEAMSVSNSSLPPWRRGVNGN